MERGCRSRTDEGPFWDVKRDKNKGKHWGTTGPDGSLRKKGLRLDMG